MTTIREAHLADIDAIQALYKELDRHHVELLPDIFRPVEGNIRPNKSISEWIQAEDRTYLVAVFRDQVVGFVSVVEKSYDSIPMYVPQRYGLIDKAIVASKFRRGGIGTQLFDAAIAWLQARGVNSAQVRVWSKNKEAMDFYTQRGFAPMYTKMQMSITSVQQADAEF